MVQLVKCLSSNHENLGLESLTPLYNKAGAADSTHVCNPNTRRAEVDRALEVLSQPGQI